MKKVWMITGAARGLGRAFVEEAVRNGDQVIAALRKVNPEDPLFQNENVLTVFMDVTDKKQVSEGVAAGLEKFGRIDFLINNAGFGMNAAFEEIEEDELRTLFETDYFGLVNVTKAVLPSMRAQKSGRILNISSQAGLVGGAGCSAYNAAKFAVVGLSQALNEEMAPWNIQVIAVCPGAFRTDFRDGSSMKYVRNPMPEYDGTPAHNVVQWLRDNNHKQPGDPVKAAAFVYREMMKDSVPRTLILGADCCNVVRKSLSQTLAEIDSYYEDTAKTAHTD